MPALYILEVVLGIGFLIVIHELGHFVVAKLMGVKVERFSIGFGPELVGFGRGETRYSIRIIPLGGYVKMLGDEPGSEAATNERSFLAQPYGKKALIIVAGSFMNIISALVLFVAVFAIGIEFPAARLGSVDYGSAAWYAGLRTGDVVVGVDGRTNVDFVTLGTRAALADPGHSISLLVRRDGAEFPVVLYPVYSPELGMGMIGVTPYPTLTIQRLPDIAHPEDATPTQNPLSAAGVPVGATITAIDGQPVDSFYDLQRRLAAGGLRPVELRYREGKNATKLEKTTLVSPIRHPQPLINMVPVATTEVVEVVARSLAERMGLAAGDVIVGIGEYDVADLYDLRRRITENLADLPPLRIRRADRFLELPWFDERMSAFAFIGDRNFRTLVLPRVAHVTPGSPGEYMGLQPGDEILSVDGREVTSFADIRTFLTEAVGTGIRVTWRRGEELMASSFEPAALGFEPSMEMVLRREGLVGSIKVGLQNAWDFASQIYLLLRKAIVGQPDIARNLRGPVSIAQTSYQFAQRGFSEFLFFLAIIGVNLGVVNLLPIPILDGGLLAMFTVEKIKGSPLSTTAQAILQYVGLAIIITLFLYVTWNDIVRLITGG